MAGFNTESIPKANPRHSSAARLLGALFGITMLVVWFGILGGVATGVAFRVFRIVMGQ